MKFTSTGKSLLELREIYGVGKGGFYDNSWWLKEPFASDRPKADSYELDIEEKKLENLTYSEQEKKLPKGWKFPHPAVLAEALLAHYKKTGKYLMEYWYSRTSLFDSDGNRVRVGDFGSSGLHVDDGYWGGGRYDYVGVAQTRQIKEGAVQSTYEETLPQTLVINGITYKAEK